MNIHTKQWFGYGGGFVACLLIRLIPFRPPNIEPLLAFQMPFAKVYGKLAGFIFASANIVLYDSITGEIGIWTLITALSYGLLGLAAAWYFKHRNSTALNYAVFAAISTIIYDAVTGLSIGPLFFQQPSFAALIGQIPFTLLHLIGNVSFALILSPALYYMAIKNKEVVHQPSVLITNPNTL